MIIKVAIVDDHQLFIDGIKSIVNTEIDIEIVAEANDGTSMLRMLREQSDINILISDIRMPGMNGLMLTRTVKKEFPDLAVLILSMFDQTSDIQEVINTRANGYLPKNVGRDILVEALYALNNGQQYFSESYNTILDEDTKISKGKDVRLTKREKQILVLIAKARTSIQISAELHISKLTVDTHRKNIHKKLNLGNQNELLKYAIEHYS